MSSLAIILIKIASLESESLVERDDKSNDCMVISDDICGAPEINNLGQFVGIASAVGGLAVSDHMNDCFR